MGNDMRMISVALCALTVAFPLAAGSARADTILDGTFNGTFNCAKYQGETNGLVTFLVSGTRVKAIMTIYHAQKSKSDFATSVLEYRGNFDAAQRKFTLTGYYKIGLEPRGWTYDNSIAGLVSADGSRVKLAGNPACTPLEANRVTATGALIR
jgi:hypothetical protein